VTLSRRKGKDAELELARVFREHGFADARRSVQYSGANSDCDVIGLPGIHVEVKRTETVRLHDWIAQAVMDAGKSGNTPVVFHRRSRSPWYAILPAGAFLELLHLAEYGHAPGEIIGTRTTLKDAAE
jgi:Holliday junction resolvase